MPIQIQIKLNRTLGDTSVPMVEDEFRRRDWKLSDDKRMTVSTGVREIDTRIKQIKFIHISIKSGGPVKLYRNMDPSFIEFEDFVTLTGLTNCSRIRLSAAEETEVHLHIAGD